MIKQHMDVFPSRDERLNPFSFYAKMRSHHHIEYDSKNEIWGIFRYSDSKEVLSNYEIFSSDIQRLTFLQNKREKDKKRSKVKNKNDQNRYSQNDQVQTVRPSILTLDPPLQRQLRNVISSAFTPNTIYNLKPRIEKTTNNLLDQVIERGQMDVIEDLAYPLPVTIIAELLGVPYRDHDLFRQWADRLLGSNTNTTNFLDRNLEPLFRKVQNEMDSYFNIIIEKRKLNPQNDLISNLIKATVDSRRLTKDEILAFCSLLLLAGHVTTVNLIGNVIRTLLEYPKQFKKLKDEQNSLIPLTIEETLRYRSPVQALFRFLIKDSVFHGHKMKEGERVVIWIGSANHDERVFQNSEEFDINRTPNDHIAFGYGIHFCLGSTLAKLEAEIVLSKVIDRLEDLRFDDDYSEDSLKPLYDVFLHGVSNLPVKFRSLRITH